MEFVLAQTPGAHEAAQEELGRYGSGRPEELRSAISDVADAVYRYGAPVLSGTDDEWDRLANLMMSR